MHGSEISKNLTSAVEFNKGILSSPLPLRKTRYAESVSTFRQYGKTHNLANTHTKKVKYEAHEFQQFAIVCDDRSAQLNELIAMHS